MKYIDAHCHVFNRDIITRRVLFSLVNEIIEILKIEHPENEKDTRNTNDSLSNSLQRIINFVKIGLFNADSIDVFNDLEKDYGNENQFIFTPLMFDLEYCFQEDYNEERIVRMIRNKDKHKEYDKLIDHTKQLSTHVGNQIDLLQKIGLSNRDVKKLKKLLEEVLKLAGKLKKPQDSIEHGVFMWHEDTGYEIQARQILELRSKYKDRIYPFLAVDPRRRNIKNIVELFVGEGKPFHGVKLYTPNGYSVTDPVLFDKGGVYEYCQNNKIPITAHCSSAGFSTFVKKLEVKGIVYINEEIQEAPKNKKIEFETDFIHDGSKAVEERALVLNYPALWEVVLDKYPYLYLNLAHFGGFDDKWRNEIYRLLCKSDNDGVLKYPNLYTDLSAMAFKEELINVKENYFDNSPANVKQKFMYGSDYYLVMIYSNSFEEYLGHFVKVFNNDFDLIAKVNPRNFLFNR